MQMKNQPTYEDANLILRLYDLRREEKLREARRWMGSLPPFTSRAEWLQVAPAGSEPNAYYRMVTTYWEMVSSFIVTGVLSSELFFRGSNFELLVVWEKVRRIVPEQRIAGKNPLTLRNLEQVATSYIEWLAENAPEFYEQFSANIAKQAAPLAAPPATGERA
jgi:hypothetical protein